MGCSLHLAECTQQPLSFLLPFLVEIHITLSRLVLRKTPPSCALACSCQDGISGAGAQHRQLLLPLLLHLRGLAGYLQHGSTAAVRTQLEGAVSWILSAVWACSIEGRGQWNPVSSSGLFYRLCRTLLSQGHSPVHVRRLSVSKEGDASRAREFLMYAVIALPCVEVYDVSPWGLLKQREGSKRTLRSLQTHMPPHPRPLLLQVCQGPEGTLLKLSVPWAVTLYDQNKNIIQGKRAREEKQASRCKARHSVLERSGQSKEQV